MHHFLSPDKLLYIPLNLISKVNLKTLGFLRGKQRTINIEYNNESLAFAITWSQKVMTGFGNPKATLEFFNILKKKLPSNIVEEPIIEKHWDYYLLLFGLLIGYTIGGILPILFCAGMGFLIGKGINKLTK